MPVSSSYIEFRGRGFWTNDNLWSIWHMLLCEQLGYPGDVPDWLAEDAERWGIQACFWGGGTPFAVPNDAWTTEQLAFVVDLARAALATIDPAAPFVGPDVAARRLRIRSDGGGVVAESRVPGEWVRQVGDGWIGLLDGTFPPNPPFAWPQLGTARGWIWLGKGEEAVPGYDDPAWTSWWRARQKDLGGVEGDHWQRTSGGSASPPPE